MRIVHVVRQFHPAIGGIEDFVMQLGRQQLARGDEVRVVTLDRVFDDPERRALPARETVRGLDVVRIPFKGSTRYPIAPGVLRHLGAADVVHVHAVDFFADFLSLTRPVHRKPLVLSTHGGYFHTDQQARLKRLYFHSVTRMAIRGYRVVIPSSLADEATFRRIRSGRIVTIENGVDLDKFAGLARPAAKTGIYFGRLAPNKGIPRLLGWFAALRRVDPDWRLIIAGKPMGVDPEAIRAEAERLTIGDAVDLFETPTDQELADLIRRCSVYLCASSYEGFGLAAVEAAAAGLFPVLSEIPAFRRTVERLGFGLLSDFAPTPLAARSFLDAWQIASDHNRAALLHRLPGAFGWPGVAASFQTAYDTAICGAAT